jgi:steroid delta-isomerase-like uncharacterized protein
MTRDEIQSFTTRFVDTWHKADVRALAACYAGDATIISPMFSTVKGREKIETSYRDLFRVFGEWRITVDQTVIDTVGGERAVLLTTNQATHVGDMFGYPGTGRRFTLRVALIFAFTSGHIASETRLYDFTGLLVQLGVLKAKAR